MMVLPSGVQSQPTAPSRPSNRAPMLQSPFVIWRGVPPSAGTTKRCRNPGSMKPRRSWRKCSDCTTRGGPVHFAPFGASGMSIFHGVDFGTTVVKPIHFPSGDQRMSDGALVRCVICDVAPSASIHRTWICVPDGLPSAR